MAEIRHFENRAIAISQRKIIRFWYTSANLELDDSHVTKTNFFKIQDRGWPPFDKSFFGHNSAANCPILVKFCTGKRNSMAIEVT